MKVPPKRKGNLRVVGNEGAALFPSMKVPPKRKGNSIMSDINGRGVEALNESPSEKEGKFFSSSEPPGTFTEYPQ